MSSSQHDAWASGSAADSYFRRNREKLSADQPPSRSARLIASQLAEGERFLEIGCANGRIVEQIRRLSRCDGIGIDPSPEAIYAGRAEFPELCLSVGTADKLPFEDRSLQAVLVGFCLYLVDRHLLMRVVAEVDRVLDDGGRLFVTDFCPPSARRRAFSHQPGLWSFKMDHTQLWTANPQYVVTERITFSHDEDGFSPDPDERIATTAMVKLPVDVSYPAT